MMFTNFICLRERAAMKVAINLCQRPVFKAMFLGLEMSTNDLVAIECGRDKEQQLKRFIDIYEKEEMEKLPTVLKRNLRYWISRIALEFLSYCKCMEILFHIKRGFLLDFLTERDWTDLGRINELILAERLIKSRCLPPLQRYRIMCFYFLHGDSTVSSELWNLLSSEQKMSMSNPHSEQGLSRTIVLGASDILQVLRSFSDNWLVKICENLVKEWDSLLPFESMWLRGIDLNMYYGNLFAIKSLFNASSDASRQLLLKVNAFCAFREWIKAQRYLNVYPLRVPYVLMEHAENSFDAQPCILLNHYADVICFSLLRMDDTVQLAVFRDLFKCHANILEVFINWPNQQYFLPVVNKLWDILPKYKFVDCLLTLACKNRRYYDWEDAWTAIDWIRPICKDHQFCDYRNLLWNLWEQSPEDYKIYLFTDEDHNDEEVDSSERSSAEFTNRGKMLTMLLQRCPFRHEDKELFRLFFQYVPVEERNTLIRSGLGNKMCSSLALAEKLSFANWLLKECLPKSEIAQFKKLFIYSDCGTPVCLYKLERNRENFLSELIDWSLESDEEKIKFKKHLLYEMKWARGEKTLLEEKGISDIDRMMDFCFPCEEEKNQFKHSLLSYSGPIFLKKLAYETIDTFLAWGFDSSEKITAFKKEMIHSNAIMKLHCNYILNNQWNQAKRLCEWCDLSPEEVIKVKKDLAASQDFVSRTLHALQFMPESVFDALRYCLVDQ